MRDAHYVETLSEKKTQQQQQQRCRDISTQFGRYKADTKAAQDRVFSRWLRWVLLITAAQLTRKTAVKLASKLDRRVKIEFFLDAKPMTSVSEKKKIGKLFHFMQCHEQPNENARERNLIKRDKQRKKIVKLWEWSSSDEINHVRSHSTNERETLFITSRMPQNLRGEEEKKNLKLRSNYPQ